jgi:hypothetical protein
MRPSKTFLAAVIAILVLAVAVLISGNSSDNGAATVSASSPLTPSATSTTTTTSTAAASASYPVVSFTFTEQGAWPFTAQIASIGENTTGFPGTGIVSPGDAVLMIQVNITSKTVRSVVPVPAFIKVLCSGPNSSKWKNEYNDNGYDVGSESAPEGDGSNIAMGDGQPHVWDAEWEVPEGTNTASVKCDLEVQEHTLALN